ncbi:MAG: LOG family protein [Chlamydiales bacterium]|jgi:predicted Rossmann-fold nucleotide-binding protein|nr:LOG family protein [Chlamydiales bacterium]
MESYLLAHHYDLVTPDGLITKMDRPSLELLNVEIQIQNISPAFVGFQIDSTHITFNLKSTLAQLGLNAILQEIHLQQKNAFAIAKIQLRAYGKIAFALFDLIQQGSYIGKLFAADPRRKVRNPDYLMRMFGRSDRQGRPLLSLGSPKGRDELLLEKMDGRTVAFLPLQNGILSYDEKAILGLLPTLSKALTHPSFRLRTLIQLDQTWISGAKRQVQENQILLVRTASLHIRTAFGKVVHALLPKAITHTTADVLEPDTTASGNVYELFGSSQEEVSVIPIEFYTLEPHREHVFFTDRDQLQNCLEDSSKLFQAFETAPIPSYRRTAIFVVKGEQLLNLKPKDWIVRDTHKTPFPGLFHPSEQALLVQNYIEQQPCYLFLKYIEDGLITSQGILLTRYFPSPFMKRMLLNSSVQRCLKGIFFKMPSLTYGNFFSHEDRSLLLDLSSFGIPVYWVDDTTNKVLQYTPKPGKDSGMFVPQPLVDAFIRSTTFGIYGSTLITGTFEEELTVLLKGLIQIRSFLNHPLLNANTPIALVTGGGPGIMEVGNRVAKRIGILSCANLVDFYNSNHLNIQEQKQNAYIEIKMTYRLDHLVERQAEFNLDFPIILPGGFGTDFEQCLEEVRRKVGSVAPTPVLLFGDSHFWRQKITSRFQSNLKLGTIKESEWVSNCFYCIQNATQGLKIYEKYFSSTLPIGPKYPPSPDGFVVTT